MFATGDVASTVPAFKDISALHTTRNVNKLVSMGEWIYVTCYHSGFPIRMFARKFSNIDFFLKILPLKDDELVMSEM